MKWILHALRNYAVFRGRARRRELWFFLLFETAVILFLGIAGRMFWPAHTVTVVKVFMLLLFLPLVAVEVRRMHDVGRSGWWVVGYWALAAVVRGVGYSPFLYEQTLDIGMTGALLLGIYLILLLGFFVQEGTPGGNFYGPDPKAGRIAGAEQS